MKRPVVAIVLSILLPGAGLAYLGMWWWAIVNFGVVALLGWALNFVFSEETNKLLNLPIALLFGIASGILAERMAKRVNERAQRNAAAQNGGPDAAAE